MRCAAISKRTGDRCGRLVSPGDKFCCYHAKRSQRLEALEILGAKPLLLREGSPELEPLALLRGVDGEILLLRAQIRRAAAEGDREYARRGIETLCKVLKVQYVLAGRSSEGLADSISRVLEEVGNELGMTL